MSFTALCVYALLMACAVGGIPGMCLWAAWKMKTPRWFFWGLVSGYALGTGVTSAIVWTIALDIAWVE